MDIKTLIVEIDPWGAGAGCDVLGDIFEIFMFLVLLKGDQ